MNIQATSQGQELKGERFSKYLIQKRISANKGLPAVTIYNLNAKRYFNSIVENWSFRNESEQEKFIQDFKNKIVSWEARKAQRKIERKEAAKQFKNDLKPGDILTDSWGYEQTNVEFYKVLDIKGSTVWIRELAHEVVGGSYQTHGMACNVLPSNCFIADAPIIKKIVRSQYIKISECVSLSKWDGRACYKSWYA